MPSSITRKESALVFAAVEPRRLERNWSQARLAREAKVSLGTYRNFMNGQTKIDTVRAIAKAVGLNADAIIAGTITADPRFGGYDFNKYSFLIGTYLLIRPRISKSEEAILAYGLKLDWDHSHRSFVMRPVDARATEIDEKLQYVDHAIVSIPEDSAYMCIHTAQDGVNALILCTYTRSKDVLMHGVILTLAPSEAGIYAPACVPITMLPRSMIKDDEIGVIDQSHSKFKEYKDILKLNGSVTESIMRSAPG